MVSDSQHPPSSGRTRAIFLAACGLLLLHASLAWLLRAVGLGTGDDHTEYLLLARSLRSFTYRDLFLVGTPLHTHYPPLHPAYLAVGSLVLGETIGRLVLLGILASTATLGCTFLALRRLFSPATALVCLLPLALNPLLITRAGTAFSEPTYGALAAIALWALAGRPSRRLLLVGGAAAIAAALTRSVGVALVVAVAAHWALERRWPPLLRFLLAAVLTIGAWTAWTVAAPAPLWDRSYVSEVVLPELPEVVPPELSESPSAASSETPRGLAEAWRGKFFQYLGISLPDQLGFPTVPGTPVDNAIGALLALLLVAAGTLVYLRRWRPAGLYLLAYVGILVVWPWSLGRFLEPLIPLTVPAALLGARSLASRLRAHWAFGVMAGLAALFAATGISRLPGLAEERRGCDSLWTLHPRECLTVDQASFVAAARFLRARPPDGVVLTVKAAPLYYRSGVRALPYRPSLEPRDATLLDLLRSVGGTHVLLASLTGGEIHRLSTLLQAECGRLELVQHFPPRTYLFRLRGDGERGAEETSPACRALERYRHDNRGRDPGQDRAYPIPAAPEDVPPDAADVRPASRSSRVRS